MSYELIRREESEKRRIELENKKLELQRQREINKARELAAQNRLLSKTRNKYRKAIFLAAIDGLYSVRFEVNDFGIIEEEFTSSGFKTLGDVVDSLRGFSWDHYKSTAMYANANSIECDLITGTKMFWLSGDDGQIFLTKISEIISNSAVAGLDNIEIELRKLQRELLIMEKVNQALIDVFSPFSEIIINSKVQVSTPLDPEEICDIFKMLGYESILNKIPDAENRFILKITW